MKFLSFLLLFCSFSIIAQTDIKTDDVTKKAAEHLKVISETFIKCVNERQNGFNSDEWSPQKAIAKLEKIQLRVDSVLFLYDQVIAKTDNPAIKEKFEIFKSKALPIQSLIEGEKKILENIRE